MFDSPVAVSGGSKRAFYITIKSSGLNYVTGSTEGALFATNDHITFFQGIVSTNHPPVTAFFPEFFVVTFNTILVAV